MSFQDQRLDFNSFSIDHHNEQAGDKNQEINPWTNSNTNILKQFNQTQNLFNSKKKDKNLQSIEIQKSKLKSKNYLIHLFQNNIDIQTYRNKQQLKAKSQLFQNKQLVQPFDLQFQLIKRKINYIENDSQKKCSQKSKSLKYQKKFKEQEIIDIDNNNLLFNKELQNIKNQNLTQKNSFQPQKIKLNQLHNNEYQQQTSNDFDFEQENYFQYKSKKTDRKKQILEYKIDITKHPLAQQSGWIPTQTRNIIRKNHFIINKLSKNNYIQISKNYIKS